ncbi:hypothetical protein [Niallia sp. 01092]|uniref:hypothetical protein n=1 Tax=unclassified Niallia TaxID=2837522 RepID=UPI003FD5EAB1
MILAIGIVYFNHKIKNASNYKKLTTTKINKLKNNFDDKFEVLSISEPFEDSGDYFVRVTCSFHIHMAENYYRKSVDDYVGQVFPTLRERLPAKVISTQVHHLSKVSDFRNKRVKTM